MYAREVGAQSELAPFLRATDIIDHGHPAICAQARALASTGSIESARGIPAGLTYQRLHYGERLVLHGLVAVHLPDMGWYGPSGVPSMGVTRRCKSSGGAGRSDPEQTARRKPGNRLGREADAERSGERIRESTYRKRPFQEVGAWRNRRSHPGRAGGQPRSSRDQGVAAYFRRLRGESHEPLPGEISPHA